MIKYFCDKCGKELIKYKEFHMKFMKQDKNIECEDPLNLANVLQNTLVLCPDCYEKLIRDLNKVLVDVKAENRFIEEA